jgi:hypothetical protein
MGTGGQKFIFDKRMQPEKLQKKNCDGGGKYLCVDKLLWIPGIYLKALNCVH